MVAGALGVGGVGAMAGGADEPAHLAPHSVRRAASSALPLATASVSASAFDSLNNLRLTARSSSVARASSSVSAVATAATFARRPMRLPNSSCAPWLPSMSAASSENPLASASCAGVFPCAFKGAFSAPSDSSIRTHAVCPLLAAACSSDQVRNMPSGRTNDASTAPDRTIDARSAVDPTSASVKALAMTSADVGTGAGARPPPLPLEPFSICVRRKRSHDAQPFAGASRERGCESAAAAVKHKGAKKVCPSGTKNVNVCACAAISSNIAAYCSDDRLKLSN